MALIVQKYGGSSLADHSCVCNVAKRIKESYLAGDQLVVVVSARRGVTDELINRAHLLNLKPNKREMDMLLAVGEQESISLLAMTLHAMDVPAVSRTGAQAGILTDSTHTKARILEVHCEDIRAQLNDERVVIVAGFQGVDANGQITTLGRGGSDLTAIALARALEADACQIFTDVAGVFTADPKVVSQASKIEQLNYEEMAELSSMGSRVMQPRAVSFAQKHDINFEVRSSFNKDTGTKVCAETSATEGALVRAIALDENQARVTLINLPNRSGVLAKIFRALSSADILVDMIVQNIACEQFIRLSFTVEMNELDHVRSLLEPILEQWDQAQIGTTGPVSKLSIVGVGVRAHSEVAAKLFDVFEDSNIEVRLISTSEIKISLAVDPSVGKLAMQLAHDAFKGDLLKEMS